MRRLSTMLAAGAVLAIALAASGISSAEEHDVEPDTRIPTDIAAAPLIKLSEPGNFFMKATLSDADGALAGKTVEFRTPGPLGTVICMDETDDAGVATCEDPATLAPVVQNQLSYVAKFQGDETHQPSEQRAGVIGE